MGRHKGLFRLKARRTKTDAKREHVVRRHKSHPAYLAWDTLAKLKWGFRPNGLEVNDYFKELTPQEQVIHDAYMRLDDEHFYRMMRVIRRGKY